MSARTFISSLLATCALSSAALAAAPLNDNIGRAFGISGTNQTVRGDNKGATREPWEAAYSGSLQGKSVWWYLDAAENGRVTLKTEGSNFDTVLLAFTYSNGRFLPAAVNDNAGNGISWSQVSLSAKKGTRYYIVVDGAGGAEGQIVLSVNRGEGVVNFTGTTASPPASAPAQPKTAVPKTSPSPVSSTKAPPSVAPKPVPSPKVPSSTIQGSIPPTVITTAPFAPVPVASSGPTPDDYKIGAYGATVNNGTNPLNLTWDTAFDLNDRTLTGITRRRGGTGDIKMLITGKSKWTASQETWQSNSDSPFSTIRHVTGVNLFAGYGVWWKWTAPEDGTVSFDTRGSECTTTLHVFDRDTRTAVYTSTGTTVTCTLTDHGLDQDASIRRSIRIVLPTQWAGKYDVTVTGPNTFTFPNPNPAVTSGASDPIMAYSGYTPRNNTGVNGVGLGNALTIQGVQGIAYTSTEALVTCTLANHGFRSAFNPNGTGAYLDWMTIVTPKQWSGAYTATVVNSTTFTFPNPNPTANGTLMCLLTDLAGGIATNPKDGRRLLAMNDNSAPGFRSSYVRLMVTKGGTYWVGVDVDQARPGGYSIITTNNVAGTVTNTAVFTIPNINVGKINLALDYTPQPRGLPPIRNLAPVITSQPSPPARMVDAGTASSTFSATAIGTQPITYQWRLNGVPVVGNSTANNSTLDIRNAHPMQIGSYTLQVTDLFGTVISSPVTFGLNGYPITITTHPNNATVSNGTAVDYTVVVNNDVTYNLQPFNYKWYKNNGTVSLVRDFNSTLTTDTLPASLAATPADIGTYYVVVADKYIGTFYESNATSNNATLAIIDYPIKIDTHPNNQTVNNGTAASFTVAATGVPSLTYQWYKSNGTVTTAVPGGTSATLTVVSATPADIGLYYVIVRDGFAGGSFETNATSNNATLAIIDYPIVINTHPNNQTITANPSDATFSVTATGVAPITYQWYRNGTIMGGETSPTLIVVNAAPANAGQYYVIVKDGFAATSYETNATSNNATLAIQPLTISTHPSNATVASGNDATFTVVASGPSPLSYQWWRKKGGSTTAVGSNSTTYTAVSVNNGDNGNIYWVIVTDGFSRTITSNNATLTVF